MQGRVVINMKLTKPQLIELIKEELDHLFERAPMKAPVLDAAKSLAPTAIFAGEEAAEDIGAGITSRLGQKGIESAGLGAAARGGLSLVGKGLGVLAAPYAAYEIGQHFEDRYKKGIDSGRIKPTALNRARSMKSRRATKKLGKTVDPSYTGKGWAGARGRDPAGQKMDTARAGLAYTPAGIVSGVGSAAGEQSQNVKKALKSAPKTKRTDYGKIGESPREYKARQARKRKGEKLGYGVWSTKDKMAQEKARKKGSTGWGWGSLEEQLLKDLSYVLEEL